MHYKTPKNRNEIMLFPQVDLLISKDNDVRIIDKIIDQIIEANTAQFKWKGNNKKGCTSYSPQTMHKLIMYGYFNWISGSRRIEKETYRNIELLWLIGDLHPDHWTICEFRRDNKEQIKIIAIEFRKFLKAGGYIEGKQIAIDGSKVKANASRDMFSQQSIKKRLEHIDTLIKSYLDEFEEMDQLEEQLENDQKDKDNLQKTIEKLEKEKEELKQLNEQLLARGKRYIAPNDLDAELMKSRDGKMPCYNIQNGVDAKNKLIVFSQVTTEKTDINLLKNDLATLKEEINVIPTEVSADKGYANITQIKEAENNSIDCIIPIQKSHKKQADIKNNINFKYDSEKDHYICGENKILVLINQGKKHRNRIYNVYQCKECNNCLEREKCTSSKKGRIIKRDTQTDWIQKYKEKISAEISIQKIKERKTIVEHPFGTIKRIMGKVPLLLTGKDKVQIEIDLYSTVYNLKRMMNIEKFDIFSMKIEEYNWKMV